MAGKTAILSIRIIADGKQAGREFKETNSQIAAFEDGLNKASIASGVAIASIGALAWAAGNAASELEQATGAVESVYGAHAAGVKQLAEDAAENVGLAESAYSNMSAILGSQLKNMGTPMDELAGQTADLIGLGADLAATFGGTTADAVGALSSLLRGERDPIERYGVSIKQADIDARLAAQGLKDLEGEALRTATTQATLALLTEQTSAAQGQFAREADTAAGAQQRANAEWENAQAALGEALLPVMTDMAGILSDVAGWVSENTELTTIIAGTILVFAGAILAANGALAAYRAIAAVATAAQIAWNVAMSANPLGLIVLAIAAVVASIIWLIANWEEVGKVAADVWAGIIGWIEDAIGWVKEALGWFGQLFGAQEQAAGGGGGGGGVGGFDDDNPAIPPAGTWTPFDDILVAHHLTAPDEPQAGTGGWDEWASPFVRLSPGAVPSGDSVHVTVNGAIDVDGTARAIEKVLDDRARRTGRGIAAPGGDIRWR